MPIVTMLNELRHRLRLKEAKRMNDLYSRTTALGLEPKIVDDIACTAHSAVMAWARSQSDFTHEIWSNCSAEHKNSMREGVLAQLENPDRSPQSNHEAWLDQKVKDGWQFGPVRDEVAKTSPALVAYRDLPVEFRKRNAIFQAVVNALDPRRYE